MICRYATRNMQNMKLKMVITALIFAASMFTVALQLYVLADLPFWETWLFVGIGELLSMTVGGITIYLISKRINLYK
ncbi:hypothetical protein AAF454_11340 [Kurthia gibsonii]|uniref:Uncharacterized protein n=2 Tax=Caryophanaceae TaxID=186818 RepID=A0ABU9LMS4_9BACL